MDVELAVDAVDAFGSSRHGIINLLLAS